MITTPYVATEKLRLAHHHHQLAMGPAGHLCSCGTAYPQQEEWPSSYEVAEWFAAHVIEWAISVSSIHPERWKEEAT